MKKFEFSKAYEEVEIGGKVYRIDFSDDKITEYQAGFNQMHKEAQEIEKLVIEDMSIKEQADILKKQRKTLEHLTEIMLGKGAFEELYELAGRSSFNYMEMLMFLGEMMGERGEKVKEDARKKYTGKRKA